MSFMTQFSFQIPDRYLIKLGLMLSGKECPKICTGTEEPPKQRVGRHWLKPVLQADAPLLVGTT